GCGQAVSERITHRVALPFIGSEVEQPVFNDVPAQRAPVLLQADRGLGIGSAVKEVARVEAIGAAKAVGGAMQLIGAGLEANAGDSAGFPAEFSGGVLLHIELLNSINGQQGGGITRDGGGVGDAQAHKGLVITYPINKVSGVLG